MPTRPPSKPPPSADAFDEAVLFFRSRLIMTDDEFKALEDAAHEKAFTIANVAQLDVVTDVWEAADRAVANGETLDDFKASVEDRLTSAWGKEMPWRIETIYRVNVQRAYNEGRWAQMEHPAVKAERPFRQFSAILDLANKDCPICPPLDGTTLPADDAFWREHLPPLHPNCRCHIVSLSESEANDHGVDPDAPAIAAADGFGQVDDTWQPDLSEYPQPLAAEYRA